MVNYARCPECGNKLKSYYHYCGRCGNQEITDWSMTFIGIGVFLVIGLLWLIFAKNQFCSSSMLQTVVTNFGFSCN